MLKDGVCTEYSKWIKHVCDDLGIPCLIAHGKGTTGHVWNLIYNKDIGEWINFDMTMARFYLDDFSKDYGEAERWASATFSEMFEMQPKRKVEKIVGDNDSVVFESLITKDNQQELIDFFQQYNSGNGTKSI